MEEAKRKSREDGNHKAIWIEEQKHRLPAGAAGGQFPAGIAAEYIIYFAGLGNFFLLWIQNIFLVTKLKPAETKFK